MNNIAHIRGFDTATRQHRQTCQSQHFIRFSPGPEFANLVYPQHQKKLVTGPLFTQLAERLDRIRRAGTLKLDVAYFKSRVTLGRGTDHPQPHRGVGYWYVLLVWWYARWNEQNRVERKHFQSILRGDEVSDVRRIESASENANFHWLVVVVAAGAGCSPRASGLFGKSFSRRALAVSASSLYPMF